MGKFEDQDLDEKRLQRRLRRKRSQLIAYIVLAVLLIAVVSGAAFGVHFLRGFLKGGGVAKVDAAQEASSEASSEEIVIETPEEEEPPQEMTDEDLLTQIVDTCISEMPLEDKVAGLFIVTPEQLTGVETAVKAGSGTQDALAKYAVGGITYKTKNIKSEDQVTDMLAATASMSKYPIFTIVAEEGTVKSGLSAAIDVIDAPEITDVETAKQAGQQISNELYKCGFNLDLAPYVELSEENHFGADLDEATNRMTAFMMGLTEYGVNCCMYSFPAAGDTASGEAVLEYTKEDLQTTYYVPFKNAIDGDNASAIMVGNVSLPNVVNDNTPASCSSVMITDELRNNLGYNGIVISGPLNDKAVTAKYAPDQAAISAIKAGADMLYLCDDFEAAYNGLLEAVRTGEISEERINESLDRIYRVKYADRVDEITQ
ncbi:MAG: beta-N-acetylhexosaminidase [Lachnospiraceae bacterium]|nr:beta-N-acetylhexosaminidase [Lachnospiraceae bacterium]